MKGKYSGVNGDEEMKGILLQNHHSPLNEFDYDEGDIVEITELEAFKDSYVVYYEETLDWIPKELIQII